MAIDRAVDVAFVEVTVVEVVETCGVGDRADCDEVEDDAL